MNSPLSPAQRVEISPKVESHISQGSILGDTSWFYASSHNHRVILVKVASWATQVGVMPRLTIIASY